MSDMSWEQFKSLVEGRLNDNGLSINPVINYINVDGLDQEIMVENVDGELTVWS